MKFKRLIFIFVGLSLCFILGYQAVKRKQTKYNVLIVSTCSLRADRLSFYNPKAARTPVIDEFARSSFVFDNAFTDMSWSNVSGFLHKFTSDYVKDLGYVALGNDWTEEELVWQRADIEKTAKYYFRTPNYQQYRRGKHTSFVEDMEILEKRLTDSKNWPFFMEVHIKTMHFPYGRRLLGDDSPQVSAQLPLDSKEYIRDYVKNYKEHPNRILFGLFFIGYPKAYEYLQDVLKFSDDEIKKMKASGPQPFIGLINNKQLLEKWQSSEYYKTDVEIIKQLYDLRLTGYDDTIKGLLSLFNNKDLQENTVIIFTGDHGEAFSEHGYLLHGETVYDEMIRFPLFIRFPGQDKMVRIPDQFYQKTIFDVAENLMKDKKTHQENFLDFIKQQGTSPYIFSRNCANNIKSIRFENKWKLIADLSVDKNYLYNLETDPLELKDVSESNPEMVIRLYEKLGEVEKLQLKNKMIHSCTEDAT